MILSICTRLQRNFDIYEEYDDFFFSKHLPVELEMLLPSQPRKETAWERGLKKAKEASALPLHALVRDSFPSHYNILSDISNTEICIA